MWIRFGVLAILLVRKLGDGCVPIRCGHWRVLFIIFGLGAAAILTGGSYFHIFFIDDFFNVFEQYF